jgi:hypothetical protein
MQKKTGGRSFNFGKRTIQYGRKRNRNSQIKQLEAKKRTEEQYEFAQNQSND